MNKNLYVYISPKHISSLSLHIMKMYICINNVLIIVIGIIYMNLISITSASVVSTGDFNKDFSITWSPSHVDTTLDGHQRSLKLDNFSGSAFASNDIFLFGQFDMQIKLIPGNSAGTVVAFYLSSNETNRDELDFEFLGNIPGLPYNIQTNVYTDGNDDREQRIRLWFDPTENFHTYSILWNNNQIVFMVDWVPIRTFRNYVDKGVAFPRFQPMQIRVSIWDGDGWASGGGKYKIDWSKAPFISNFRNHKIDACIWKGNARECRVGNPTNWWNLDGSSTLTSSQRKLFRWVRKYFLLYDYCQDPLRFHNQLPRECSLPSY